MIQSKRTFLAPIALSLVLLASCTGGTVDTGDPTPLADTDHDGYTTQVDCDDTNAAVHPGMAEICGDGIDQDCNGSDEACAACGDAVVSSAGCACGGARHIDGICCADAWHADGYCCASTWQAGACASCGDGDSDGYDDALCGGDDCNDALVAVHPGAAETCGDGVDQDCSGADLACGTETPTSIAEVAAACAAEPYLPGTVYYYCDCGTGAQGDCVAGDNANAGTDPLLPRRTIGDAVARFGVLAVNDTVALCKGGAFDSAGGLSIGSNRCGAGAACNDLREYTPTTFAGTAKPIINNAAGDATLFTFMGSGGIRLLNLKLKGDGGTIGNRNRGFFFYEAAHDVTICNLDMDAFDMAVYNESNAPSVAANTHIKITGNMITNSRLMGLLGGGDNDDVSYNYWDGNGSSTVFDHTLYFASSRELHNMRVVGNYVRGQYGSTCLGAAIEAHMPVDGLLVKDNVIDIAPSANTGGCWGIEFNNLTGGTAPVYNRNAIFSGNTIKNGGNLALTVTGCPDCVIENNLIIIETSIGGIGISVATAPPRSGVADDVNTRNAVRNNTIWFGPNANTGGIGIQVGIEGAGHIIANNTVTYSAAATGGYGFSCFRYPLSLSSYALINNNHCFSNAAYSWEATQGSLAEWQAYADVPGFDTESFTGDPLFTAAGTDFTPGPGSPLVGAGSAAYGSALDITGATRPSPPAIGAYEP